VAALAEYFLAKLSLEAGVPHKYLVGAALAFLERAGWAGNVRELQHALERAFILAGNDLKLGVQHFQTFGEASQLREI